MEIKVIDRNMLETLRGKAGDSPRKRTNHNLHAGPDDPVQRLFIAAEPGSYFRPNRHVAPDTWEIIVVLRGSYVLLVFDEAGIVRERFVLSAGGDVAGVEIPPRTWHTLAVLEPGSIFFEVKQGPYHPVAEKDFVAWAPPEGSPDAARFEAWFRSADIGACPPV